jgi:hypothetical protein
LDSASAADALSTFVMRAPDRRTVEHFREDDDEDWRHADRRFEGELEHATLARIHDDVVLLLRLAVEHRGSRSFGVAPRVQGTALRLEPIDYERDPGFDEWKIKTRKAGRATIAVSGKACTTCMVPIASSGSRSP